MQKIPHAQCVDVGGSGGLHAPGKYSSVCGKRTSKSVLRLAAVPDTPSRRRDCHVTDTLCLSLLKHLLKVQGGCHQMPVSPTAGRAAAGCPAVEERVGEVAVDLACFEPGGSACCYWNAYGSSAATRPKDSPWIPSSIVITCRRVRRRSRSRGKSQTKMKKKMTMRLKQKQKQQQPEAGRLSSVTCRYQVILMMAGSLKGAQPEVVTAIWCPVARFIRIRGD